MLALVSILICFMLLHQTVAEYNGNIPPGVGQDSEAARAQSVEIASKVFIIISEIYKNLGELEKSNHQEDKINGLLVRDGNILKEMSSQYSGINLKNGEVDVGRAASRLPGLERYLEFNKISLDSLKNVKGVQAMYANEIATFGSSLAAIKFGDPNQNRNMASSLYSAIDRMVFMGLVASELYRAAE